MLTRSVLLVTACLIALPAWAVNKCITSTGKVIYQDAPCPDEHKKGQVNLSGAGQADPTSEGSQYWKKEALRQKRDDLVAESIANRRVAIGMTADETIASWGRPTKINSSIGSYGKHEQWVYDRGNFRSQYVYLENGRVTSIQSPE